MKKNKFFEFIRSFNLIPKLVCLLLAFVFWIYVMQVDSPDNEEIFEDVPITITGTTTLENDRNLSIFSGYDTLVDVTVKGKKSDVSRYSSDDIVVTVDVSDIEKTGMHELELFYDLPSGLNFVKSSVSQISIFVDKRTSSSVEVRPLLKSYKLSTSEYTIGEITCDTDIITVTGPESYIKDVSYACVEVNMGDAHLTHSVSTDGNIVLKNQNDENIDSKYVKLSKNTVLVNVPVYTFKSLPLRAIGKYGYYTKDNAQITVFPESVRVKGDPAVLSTIDHLDITTLDEKNIAESTDLIVDISLPDNIFPVEGEPTNATVSVELKGLTKKTFAVDNIELVNASSKKKFTVLDKTVAVTVLADAVALKGLESDDIVLTVDLSDYSEVTGIIYPTATVTINSKDGTVYELGIYSIKVEAK